MWVIGRLEPSLIMMSLVPMYGACRERLLRSDVTWCEAPLSKSHDDVVEGLVVHIRLSKSIELFSYTFAAIKYIYWITNICLKS